MLSLEIPTGDKIYINYVLNTVDRISQKLIVRLFSKSKSYYSLHLLYELARTLWAVRQQVSRPLNKLMLQKEKVMATQSLEVLSFT